MTYLPSQVLDYTREEERNILRKLDLNILTIVCAGYFVSYLDRSNIGFANTAGMSEDTGITNSQYLWLTTAFYIGYIITQWLAILWKVWHPKYVMLATGLGIAASTALMSTGNWPVMMTVRVTLAICEAAFGGVPYYLTFFYKPTEMKRVGWYMAMAPFSASVSGQIAWGISSQSYPALHSWQVLFIVEAAPSIVTGFLGLLLPAEIPDCGFLSSREKVIGRVRTTHRRANEKLESGQVLTSLLSVRLALITVIAFSNNVAFGSFVIFVSEIIHDMGYSALAAQGMSAPPFLLSGVAVLLSVHFSDKLQQRGFFIFGFSILASIGYLILATVTTAHVRYVGTFFVAVGIYPSVTITLIWNANLFQTDTERGTGFSAMAVLAQCGTLAGARLFPQSDSPRYLTGCWVSFAFMANAACFALILRGYLSWQNRRSMSSKSSSPKLHPHQQYLT